MWEWLKAAQILHAIVLAVAAIGALRFAIRTRFWLPRYVHYLAGLALALGLASLSLLPPDAPIHRSDWGGLKRARMALIFPGLVHLAFVVLGGQQVAYEREHGRAGTRCPSCGQPNLGRGQRCPSCGRPNE
jgi:hypothetical protein